MLTATYSVMTDSLRKDSCCITLQEWCHGVWFQCLGLVVRIIVIRWWQLVAGWKRMRKLVRVVFLFLVTLACYTQTHKGHIF